MEGWLREMVGEGATLARMAAELGVDRSTIRRWLRRHGLETPRMARLRVTGAAREAGRDSVVLRCPRHGMTEFRLREDRRTYRCLQCRSLDVSNARRRRKEQLVREAGGRCQACGYADFVGALQFHHLDPAEKAFGLSSGGIPRALGVARREASKCVLLCANCHAEVEAGFRHLEPTLSLRASRVSPSPVM